MIKISWYEQRIENNGLLLKKNKQFDTMKGVTAFLRALQGKGVIGKPLIEDC